MTLLPITPSRVQLYQLLDDAAESQEPILIKSKLSNAVLVSESDWRSIQLWQVPVIAGRLTKSGCQKHFEISVHGAWWKQLQGLPPLVTPWRHGQSPEISSISWVIPSEVREGADFSTRGRALQVYRAPCETACGRTKICFEFNPPTSAYAAPVNQAIACAPWRVSRPVWQRIPASAELCLSLF